MGFFAVHLFVEGAAIAFGARGNEVGFPSAKFFILNGGARSAKRADWFDAGHIYPVDENGRSMKPLHFTARIDEKRGEWDLFFKGRLQYAGIRYKKSIKGIVVKTASARETKLSNIAYYDENPLFEDLDLDGIEDFVEIDLGFSTEENDRNLLDELVQYTNLQHFIKQRRVYSSRAVQELETVIAEAIVRSDMGLDASDLDGWKFPDEWRSRGLSKKEVARTFGVELDENGLIADESRLGSGDDSDADSSVGKKGKSDE